MDEDDDLFGLDLPPPPKIETKPPPRETKREKRDTKTVSRETSRPTEVPILVEEDLVWEGQFQNGRRDLRYWMIATFGEDTAIRAEAEEALGEVIRVRGHCLFPGVARFVEQANRNRWPSLARQAVFWNEMLSDLGYEVPKASLVFRPEA